MLQVARVIDIPMGVILTSPANAHSFGRGDKVVIGDGEAGYAVLTVTDNI